MTVFVLGAGATRGASFVNPTKNPCLPPLDADFYAQLQRIGNKKHRETVKKVIADTVELFGPNFQVTMETVFTTLEHTARMTETTGEKREFKKSDLELKKERLKQAIAATLEESLCDGGLQTGSPCEYHSSLVDSMKPKETIITFNYDCLVDETLKLRGDNKWNPRYGYGFKLGKGRTNLKGDKEWAPKVPSSKDATINLYKLHGSLHFDVAKELDGAEENVTLKRRPYTKQRGNLRFTIIPPESNKRYDEGVFKRIWNQASRSLYRTGHLVVIGYSFPPTDSHSNALFRISTPREGLKTLVIVNPDKAARYRTREVLKRGLSAETRVVIFDRLSEFVAADRSLWG
jgi:hypothetical protein